MSLAQRIIHRMSGKIILSIFLGIIAMHIVLLSFFLQDNRAAIQSARRDEVIQKIINAIYLVEATPIANRAHAVAAMADPVLKVTFSKKPLWPLQFKQVSFWPIIHALRNKLDAFSISIMLSPGQWLNLNAAVYSRILTQQLLMIGLEILVFGTILIVLWSMIRFTRPLKNFTNAVDKLGIDLESTPLDIDGPTVVREAARAMNKMQQRIKDLIRDRTQVLAAISHDLRTPITRMKIRSQFLDDKSLQSRFVHDLDEMEAMISETLSFAREESAKEDKVKLDLVSLLQTICEEMQDMGHKIIFDSTINRVVLTGRSLALKRAFTNLINNAIRYANAVEVHISQNNNRTLVTIKDDGPGIAQEDLTHVFQPFYRGEQSRSRDTGGVGLGLAVTADIIKAHEGRITLQNLQPHGLCVCVEFDLNM